MAAIGKLMTPKDMVATCYPSDTIESVLSLAVSKVGAVVVLHEHGMMHIPVGLVTKTDLLEAYKAGLPRTHKVQEIMSRTIESIPGTASKETALEHFKRTKHHHAFVVSSDTSQWEGVLGVWDLAFEAARKDRSWPWNLEAVDDFVAHASPRMKLKHDFAQTEKHQGMESESFVIEKVG